MINSNKYRIKETIYRDGHKQYIGQVRKSLFFIKYWKNIVLDWRCCSNGFYCYRCYCEGCTYEECHNKLKDYIEKEERYNASITVDMVNYLEV